MLWKRVKRAEVSDGAQALKGRSCPLQKTNSKLPSVRKEWTHVPLRQVSEPQRIRLP